MDKHVALEALYRLHVQGQLDGHDQRWLEVHSLLEWLGDAAVRKFARGLSEAQILEQAEEVGGELMRKFIEKRFQADDCSLTTVLWTSARNAMHSSFRRSRSPTAIGLAPKAHSRHQAAAVRPTKDVESGLMDGDLFGKVRNRFGQFRFGEFEFAREIVLAFLLTHGKYPGPGYLHMLGVHYSIRVVVYNAAVVDINRAIQASRRAA